MANDPPPPTVLQLSRTLQSRPVIAAVPGIQLRQFGGGTDRERDVEQDIDAWLEIRHRAFAKERLGVRTWTDSDFRREFLDKPWWNAERLWFAETTNENQTGASIIGTVALADRARDAGSLPAVHWLAVLPGYRKQGVGRLLMATLEAYCWDHGWTEIALETHAKWRRATAFYHSLGYRNPCDKGRT